MHVKNYLSHFSLWNFKEKETSNFLKNIENIFYKYQVSNTITLGIEAKISVV